LPPATGLPRRSGYSAMSNMHRSRFRSSPPSAAIDLRSDSSDENDAADILAQGGETRSPGRIVANGTSRATQRRTSASTQSHRTPAPEPSSGQKSQSSDLASFGKSPLVS
jgi:hypothetical protein